MMHSGQVDDAIDEFERVIQNGQRDDVNLMAHLGKAQALDKNGNHGAALTLLRTLDDHPSVQQYMLYRLLVVDLMHQLMLKKAMQVPESRRAAEIDLAYQPYEDLLNDPDLGDQAGHLKFHVFHRWRLRIDEGGDVTAMAPPVVRAIGELSRIEGQNLSIQAEELADAGQGQAAADLIEQARPKLQQSIQINEALLERKDLGARIRSDAMYNLAMSQYFIAQGDVQIQLEACRNWTDLADEMSDQPTAEESITFAITVLHQLFDNQPHPPEIDAAYERCGKVLFEKFPTSDAADNERHYYAFHILSKRGQYAEAVEMLSKVPPGHAVYYEARRLMLLNLTDLLRQADGQADQKRWEDRLVQTADNLVREIDRLVDDSPEAINAKGWGKLVLVDVALQHDNFDEALRQLDGFDREFADDPELVRESLQRAIVVLARSGQLGDCVTRAKTMMELFPDDAAYVIDDVLTTLDLEVEALEGQSPADPC